MSYELNNLFVKGQPAAGASDEQLKLLTSSLGEAISKKELRLVNSSLRHRKQPHQGSSDPSAWKLPTQPLPDSYLQFLRHSNGGDFSNGRRFFKMLPADEIRPILLHHHLPQHMPGAVPFALDVSENLYVFDMRRGPVDGEYPVLLVSARIPSFDDAEVVGSSFFDACKGPPPLAEEVLRRLKAIPIFRQAEFHGCTADEIARLEEQFKVRLPGSFKEFLAHLGKGVGDFLTSDHWVFKYRDLFEIARSDEYAEFCDLPEHYFVFAARNGYAWAFFVADGGSEDPPIYMFDDGRERSFIQNARTIWEWVESLVVYYEMWYGSDLADPYKGD